MAAPRVSKSLQTDSFHTAAKLRVPCARMDKCLRTSRQSPNKACADQLATSLLMKRVEEKMTEGGEGERIWLETGR